MNVIEWLARKSGLDIRSEEYSFGEDPVLGFTATRKHADRWVNSTCGYCSVGCGMQLGVREDKVVSVRGNFQLPTS
jgi:anaerobic selenocysteine-containing dehydrogenase